MNKTWIQEKIDENRYNQEIKRSGGIRMAKRGGFPGGMPGNMSNLMKQAQKMQRQMEETTKELEGKEYSASSGGGAVTVTVSGKKEVTAVKISPEAVDPEDVEMLEDMIMAAVNEAFRQMEDASSQAMSKLTGGMGGGFPF
jgi:DNA-binding YbaB/EbfC family protein